MIGSFFEQWVALTDAYRLQLADVESRGQDPAVLAGLAAEILALESSLPAWAQPPSGAAPKPSGA